MDSTSTPQETQPQTQNSVTPTQPVTMAESVMNTPQSDNSNPVKPKPNGSKLVLIVLVVFVVLAIGGVGYYLVAQSAQIQEPEQSDLSSEPTTVTSPTPVSESEEVDQVETSFPESDLNSIQTDVQSL